VQTNIAFFREVLADGEFRDGRLSTAFLDGFFARRPKLAAPEMELEAAAVLAAVLASGLGPEAAAATPAGRWLAEGRESALR
jgi:pyruvate carboxylase